MNEISEIDELINEIKKKCSGIVVPQLTGFGENSSENGIWRFWLNNNEDVYVNIEVHDGMLWALYASEELKDKYPIDAIKIYEFLHKFNKV